MHPVTVEHIERRMKEKYIDVDVVRKNKNPQDCEADLEELFYPLERVPQIRAPTVEDVKHYLYQYVNKDLNFIREFDSARKRRHIQKLGDPDKMKSITHLGSRPRRPKAKLERLIRANLFKHGTTLRQVQESNDPLFVASLILPPLMREDTKSLTGDGEADARRVLHHLILKSRDFINQTLACVGQLQLPVIKHDSQSRTDEEGANKEDEEAARTSVSTGFASIPEEKPELVKGYQPWYNLVNHTYTAPPYYLRHPILQPVDVPRHLPSHNNIRQWDPNSEDRIFIGQLARVSQMTQPSSHQLYAGYGDESGVAWAQPPPQHPHSRSRHLTGSSSSSSSVFGQHHLPLDLIHQEAPASQPISPQAQFDDSGTSSSGQIRSKRRGYQG